MLAHTRNHTETVVAPPALYLLLVREHLKKEIGVAAQNVFDKPNGAFTGEISVSQLQDSNIGWTILGHSERRTILAESDATVASKTKYATENGVSVIWCCGESLEQREAGQTLEHIAQVIGSAPEDFNLHRNLKRILANRSKTVLEGKNIDWSTAEALAFGSLVAEGHHVRVSGQDVERGTFSQRHAVFHDQENENTYTPLQHISGDQAKFVISNSSLSEFGALGFEYGYSLSSPNALVMWEAQFGDFANNAQCIIDQFIASGEVKWMQRTGLVMSLPHGYDGQGPEHSSGRLERYLQLSNEDPRVFPSQDRLERQHQDCNMQVVYMTTPANLFHVLRRQMHRQFRKRKPSLPPFL